MTSEQLNTIKPLLQDAAVMTDINFSGFEELHKFIKTCTHRELDELIIQMESEIEILKNNLVWCKSEIINKNNK